MVDDTHNFLIRCGFVINDRYETAYQSVILYSNGDIIVKVYIGDIIVLVINDNRDSYYVNDKTYNLFKQKVLTTLRKVKIKKLLGEC